MPTDDHPANHLTVGAGTDGTCQRNRTEHHGPGRHQNWAQAQFSRPRPHASRMRYSRSRKLLANQRHQRMPCLAISPTSDEANLRVNASVAGQLQRQQGRLVIDSGTVRV